MTSLLTAVDIFKVLINSGSLVDPISNRSGDFAFIEDLRLSGQFPKIYIDTSFEEDDYDYTFGPSPEYMSGAQVRIYFYTKLSKESIFTDSTGSYKNSRLVRRYQQLIKDMVNNNLPVFHLAGIHNVKCVGTSEPIRRKETGMYAGFISFDMQWRDT